MHSPAHLRRFSALWILFGIATFPAFSLGQATTKAAQVTPPAATPAPEVRKTAGLTVEVGEIEHVPYRIDLPDNWNHRLIVYYHGYSQSPLHFKTDAPSDLRTRPMLKAGYAVVRSAYAHTGWAMESGFIDTERARKYFVKKYGQPKETYVVGQSLGGALTMETIERNPKPYNGALNLCGAVGPALTHLNRRFALRAAFDFYFPGVLPGLNPVPANFADTEAVRLKVKEALTAKPAAAESMRSLLGFHSNGEVATMMVYFTYVIGDMQRKAGGNPFDNRNTIYTGSSLDTHTDYALNDGVQRYAADPKAERYLIDHYSPNGKVTKPTLALHTVYDQYIPANTLTLYSQIIETAGYSQNYVQQYVHREGHCTFTTEEVGRAFDDLVTWVHGGKAPVAGLLK